MHHCIIVRITLLQTSRISFSESPIIMIIMLWTIIRDDPDAPPWPWSVTILGRDEVPTHSDQMQPAITHTASQSSISSHFQLPWSRFLPPPLLSSLSVSVHSPGLTWWGTGLWAWLIWVSGSGAGRSLHSGSPHRSQISDLSREKIVVSDVSRIPTVTQQLRLLRQGTRSKLIILMPFPDATFRLYNTKWSENTLLSVSPSDSGCRYQSECHHPTRTRPGQLSANRCTLETTEN